MNPRLALRCLPVILYCAVLSGCAHGDAADATAPNSPTTDTQGVSSKPFQLSDFAKSDVDEIAEIHITSLREHLATLMRKLYKRNPSQWRDHNKPSAEYMVQRVFRPARVPDFVELRGRRAVAAIRLAFDETYDGDRVLALLAGLTDMVQKAYGGKREFYLLDTLDPQKLYNSARNVEIAAWLLRSRVDATGKPLILSHAIEDETTNLSFERLFGKIISLQDTLAQIVAGRTNRTIRTVVQRMVGAVFLPI